MICCISYEGYIGIVASLIGACAVFITVSPLFFDKRYKSLKGEIDKLRSEIQQLKEDVSPLRKNRKENESALQAGFEKSKKRN